MKISDEAVDAALDVWIEREIILGSTPREDMRAALVAASAVAEREAALDELAAQAQEHDMGYGKEADMIDEFKLSEAKIAIAREEDTIRRLLERVAEAFSDAIEGWDECAEYKGDYLRKKHNDDKYIAEARSVLAEVRKALEEMK